MNSSFDANLRRGQLLHDQGRYSEAEDYLKQALSEDPSSAEALMMLAWCQFNQDNRDKEALATLDRAILEEPGIAQMHGLRALILASLKRFSDGHASAEQAIALDPDSSFSYSSKAQVFAGEQKWAKMEENARKALTLDGDDELAQNQLTQALLLQGKTEENASNVRKQLERDPDDPLPHLNAGYAALRRGDQAKAEEHFREALRLRPSLEPAREGMLEAFRARSLVYRSYLKWSFWMAKFTQKFQWGLIIGIYVLYRFVVAAANQINPLLGLLVIVLYVSFALWTHVARGVGNLIVLTDRNGRLALRRNDTLEGIFVGGFVCAGLLLVLSVLIVGKWSLFLAGAVLASTAVPLAASFNNDDSVGRKLYAALGIAVFAFGSITLVQHIAGLEPTMRNAWIWTFVGAIWLSAFGFKRG